MSLLKPLVFGKPRLEYLLCVNKDLEFKNKVEQIRNGLKLKKGEKLAWKEVDYVRTPVVVGLVSRPVSKKLVTLIGAIESEFELGSSETIDLINDDLPTPEEGLKSVLFSSHQTENESVTLLSMWIFPGASKRDIIESLDGIESRIEKFYGISPKKRTKGPQNYQLIYAIHRARRKGKKFSEIFNEYSLGKLENYSGARAITSVNKFREYYRKYEPKEPSKTMWILDADTGEMTSKDIGLDQDK